MKTRVSLVVATLAAFMLLAFSALPALAQGEVEFDVGAPVEVETFHSRLSPYGQWVHVNGYGEEVWVPNGTRDGWRPYSDGQWVMTEYGWTFVSDDSWGWATWHYGNWMLTDDAGWVWAPGQTWAPAWVSWRYGGGYAAWAPLPPAGYYVSSYGYESPAWVVVHERDFNRPIQTVVISRQESVQYVQIARPLPAPVRAGRMFVNPGPRSEVISQAVGSPVRPVSARAVVGHGTRSIQSAPAAPHAPAPVASAMQRSWSRQPAPVNPARPIAPNPSAPQAQHQPGLHPNQPPQMKPGVTALPPNAVPPARGQPGFSASNPQRPPPAQTARPQQPQPGSRGQQNFPPSSRPPPAPARPEPMERQPVQREPMQRQPMQREPMQRQPVQQVPMQRSPQPMPQEHAMPQEHTAAPPAQHVEPHR